MASLSTFLRPHRHILRPQDLGFGYGWIPLLQVTVNLALKWLHSTCLQGSNVDGRQPCYSTFALLWMTRSDYFHFFIRGLELQQKRLQTVLLLSVFQQISCDPCSPLQEGRGMLKHLLHDKMKIILLPDPFPTMSKVNCALSASPNKQNSPRFYIFSSCFYNKYTAVKGIFMLEWGVTIHWRPVKHRFSLLKAHCA